jgi:hypothetical protein
MTGTVWYGRTAHPDRAAERLRVQHRACAERQSDAQPYLACYFDVGVGYRGADRSGPTLDPRIIEATGLPHAGGMAQLLADANDPAQHFDQVVCFELDRISRNAQFRCRVIDSLTSAEVDLLVPSMAGLAATADRSPFERYTTALALTELQADHTNRFDRSAGSSRSGKDRR